MTQAESPMNDLTYVEYREDLESPTDDEQQLIEKMIASLRDDDERAFKKYKKGIRDAHAKSHGNSARRNDCATRPSRSVCARASSRRRRHTRSSRGCPRPPVHFAVTRFAACAGWASRCSKSMGTG